MIELGDIGRQEATGLLERHLRRKEQLLSDEARTAKLLRELAYLPLAITQAAAYIAGFTNTITAGGRSLIWRGSRHLSLA